MKIKDGSVLLFQGDSITDTNRNDSPDGLGFGYPKIVADRLKAAGSSVRVINRGVGGNKTADLVARFERDFRDVKPDYVSLLIGVNDVWHGYNGECGTYTSDDAFEANLRTIVSRVKEEMKVPLVMMEPYILDTRMGHVLMKAELFRKVHIYRAVAMQYADEYISLEGRFAERYLDRPPEHWSFDGIHPTEAGHALIADWFMRATGLL